MLVTVCVCRCLQPGVPTEDHNMTMCQCLIGCFTTAWWKISSFLFHMRWPSWKPCWGWGGWWWWWKGGSFGRVCCCFFVSLHEGGTVYQCSFFRWCVVNCSDNYLIGSVCPTRQPHSFFLNKPPLYFDWSVVPVDVFFLLVFLFSV